MLVLSRYFHKKINHENEMKETNAQYATMRATHATIMNLNQLADGISALARLNDDDDNEIDMIFL